MALCGWIGRVALLLLLGAGSAAAQGSISGAARAVDGDTLAIGDVRVRLFGVDAPEMDQSCEREDGAAWACGRAAGARLGTLVAGQTVRCTPRDRDRYGRVVATCTAGGVDVGARLVAEGLAWAFRRYSTDYVASETRAKSSRLGLWRGTAEPAWDYRASRRTASTGTEPPGACRIKGNINADGARIYHTPGSRWYARTRIDMSRGQRWFCTEDEARAAGWRPPRGS